MTGHEGKLASHQKRYQRWRTF